MECCAANTILSHWLTGLIRCILYPGINHQEPSAPCETISPHTYITSTPALQSTSLWAGTDLFTIFWLLRKPLIVYTLHPCKPCQLVYPQTCRIQTKGINYGCISRHWTGNQELSDKLAYRWKLCLHFASETCPSTPTLHRTMHLISMWLTVAIHTYIHTYICLHANETCQIPPHLYNYVCFGSPYLSIRFTVLALYCHPGNASFHSLSYVVPIPDSQSLGLETVDRRIQSV